MDNQTNIIIEKSNDEIIDTKLIFTESREYINDIICTICLNIAFYPSNCINCKGVFCKNCIERWIEINNNCPRCRNQSNYIELDREKDVYKKVKMKCSNSSRGCSEVILYSIYEEHINHCNYSLFYCLGKNCNFVSKWDKFNEHLNDCELFKKNYKLDTVNKYYCIQEQVITCLDCNENFIFRDFNSHIKNCKCETDFNKNEDLDEIVRKKINIIIASTSFYNTLVIALFVFLYFSNPSSCEVYDKDIYRIGFLKVVWVLFFLPLLKKSIRNNMNIISKTKIAFFTFFLINAIFCVFTTINFCSQMASIENNNICKNLKIAFMSYLLVEWFYIIIITVLNFLANKISE